MLQENYKNFKKVLIEDFKMQILESEDSIDDPTEKDRNILVGIRFAQSELSMILTINIKEDSIVLSFSNITSKDSKKKTQNIKIEEVMKINSKLKYGSFIVYKESKGFTSLEYRYSFMIEKTLSEDFFQKVLTTSFQIIAENAPKLLKR